MRWTRGKNLGEVAGKAVCLRFVLRDADLFWFWFAEN